MTYRTTSLLAWKSFLPVSPVLDDMIIAVLKAVGAVGITCDAIEDIIERSHQAVSGNLRHLVQKGRAKDSGTKGKTKTGRAAINWVLA